MQSDHLYSWNSVLYFQFLSLWPNFIGFNNYSISWHKHIDINLWRIALTSEEEITLKVKQREKKQAREKWRSHFKKEKDHLGVQGREMHDYLKKISPWKYMTEIKTYLTIWPDLFFVTPPTRTSSGQCMYFVAKPKHPPVSSAPISNGCIKQKILKLEIKLEINRFKNKLDIN